VKSLEGGSEVEISAKIGKEALCKENFREYPGSREL